MREGERESRQFAKRLRKKMPRSEALLWSYIRKRGLNGAKFRRQHPIGPYIADFACIAAKLVVEVDGATHSSDQLAYDTQRTKYLERQGWSVLRVSNTDAYKNMDGVWRTIAAQLRPPPPPACAGVRDLPASGEDEGRG
jgi:very-short-patch-repair endonuclease